MGRALEKVKVMDQHLSSFLALLQSQTPVLKPQKRSTLLAQRFEPTTLQLGFLRIGFSTSAAVRVFYLLKQTRNSTSEKKENSVQRFSGAPSF